MSSPPTSVLQPRPPRCARSRVQHRAGKRGDIARPAASPRRPARSCTGAAFRRTQRRRRHSQPRRCIGGGTRPRVPMHDRVGGWSHPHGRLATRVALTTLFLRLNCREANRRRDELCHTFRRGGTPALTAAGRPEREGRHRRPGLRRPSHRSTGRRRRLPGRRLRHVTRAHRRTSPRRLVRRRRIARRAARRTRRRLSTDDRPRRHGRVRRRHHLRAHSPSRRRPGSLVHRGGRPRARAPDCRGGLSSSWNRPRIPEPPRSCFGRFSRSRDSAPVPTSSSAIRPSASTRQPRMELRQHPQGGIGSRRRVAASRRGVLRRAGRQGRPGRIAGRSRAGEAPREHVPARQHRARQRAHDVLA